MRKFFTLLSLIVFLSITLAAYAAAGVRVKVTDPDSRPVAGARVTVFEKGSDRPAAVVFTAADGTAELPQLTGSDYRIEVLAAGFAPAETVSTTGDASIALTVAARAETVNVTATITELPLEQTGAVGATLDHKTLELMQPVAVSDALRFLPGAIINTAGRRGGLGSLFVRGGESRYNKVIIDGVPVNDPGGTFDFGPLQTFQIDRIEFIRGAQSTLYGSDAMTSVVQIFTPVGSTRVPEFRFGAEGGTFSTARGYASLAGAYRRLDYNLFGDQTNTQGQGVNDEYSNSAQGANIGVKLTRQVDFRFRTRHSNSRSGIQSFWNFNGQPLTPPDSDQYARQNNFLASGEFDIVAPSRWRHRISGYEYNHRRLNKDALADRGCAFPFFLDCDFEDLLTLNRAGAEYRGEFTARAWARSTFGYSYENENGYVNQDFSGFIINSHGLRRNHALYFEQVLNWRRFSVIGGVRYVNNESFGNKAIPHIAATAVPFQRLGTRFRFAYGQGIKEPRLEESFGAVGAFGPVTIPNPELKEERNRSIETGFTQAFGRFGTFSATYFNNLFKDQIAFSFDPVTFTSQYVNVNQAMAHGAELEFHVRPARAVSFDASYTHNSTQILRAPLCFTAGGILICDPLLAPGRPLLRRPKHSGTMMVNYIGKRWGGNLGGSFVGRRSDSDFLGLASPPVDHAAGYARVDVGGWYAIHRNVTGYVAMENALNKRYEEAAGYPALKANFRAGVRFRIGGD